MGQTVACANQKGGVGKTTTVVNLGAYLALAGIRVLVVDLDPQGNATSGLGVDRNLLERSMYDAVVDGVDIRELVTATPVAGLDLAPSAIALAGAEVELAREEQRERRLARSLDAVRDAFDYLLIDCPPSLGLLTVNALTAADAVLIPIQCEYYALEGLTQLIATVNLVRDHLNPDLAVEGVVLTMFDPRTNLSSQVSAEVRAHLGAAVYDTVIPRNVRLSEAPSYGLPIPLYRPDSKGAAAYAALADEVIARGQVGAAARSGNRDDGRSPHGDDPGSGHHGETTSMPRGIPRPVEAPQRADWAHPNADVEAGGRADAAHGRAEFDAGEDADEPVTAPTPYVGVAR